MIRNCWNTLDAAILIFILAPTFNIHPCEKQHKDLDIWNGWAVINTPQLNWIQPGNSEREREVFVRAFKKAYENFSSTELGIRDDNNEYARTWFFYDSFRKEMIDYNNDPNSIWLLSVQLKGLHETKVIGFASFQATKNPGEICIRQLTVDPEYWGKGIGKMTVFAIQEKVKDIHKYVLVTRFNNLNACRFYEKIGFKKSNYMREGFDPKKFIGYELNIKKEH